MRINDWIVTPEGLGQVASDDPVTILVRLPDRLAFLTPDQCRTYDGRLVPVFVPLFEQEDRRHLKALLKGDFLTEYKRELEDEP